MVCTKHDAVNFLNDFGLGYMSVICCLHCPCIICCLISSYSPKAILGPCCRQRGTSQSALYGKHNRAPSQWIGFRMPCMSGNIIYSVPQSRYLCAQVWDKH